MLIHCQVPPTTSPLAAGGATPKAHGSVAARRAGEKTVSTSEECETSKTFCEQTHMFGGSSLSKRRVRTRYQVTKTMITSNTTNYRDV